MGPSRLYFLLVAVSVILLPCCSFAQESKGLDKLGEILDVEVNLSNNHLWRGFEVSDGIVMSSTFAVHDKANHVRAGVWSGTNSTGDYKEFNFIAELSMKGWKLSYLDAMNYSPKNAGSYNVDDFFDYKAHSTGRFIDLALSYDFGDSFPLTLSWATIFFGRDRYEENSQTGEKSKNRYSTYCSADYRLYKDEKWEIGASLAGAFALNSRKSDRSTFYSDKPGIVQIQLKATRDISITRSYSVPFHVAGMWNPVMRHAYFQIGAQILSF